MTQFPGKLVERLFPGQEEDEDFPGEGFPGEPFTGREPLTGLQQRLQRLFIDPRGPVFTLQQDLAKSVARGVINLGRLPFEQAASIASITRFGFEQVTGIKTPLTPQEKLARKVRRGIARITGPGSALEAANVESFDPLNPLWWTSRGGEGMVFLATAIIPGAAVASSARAIGVKVAGKFAARAAGLTSASLESAFAKDDFVRGLEERGLTPAEAEIIATGGAGAYGIVAGFLDTINLGVLLRKFSRPVIMNALKVMAFEGLTESIQRAGEITTGLLIGADPHHETLLEAFRDPETIRSILGEGLLGFVISGGPAIGKAFLFDREQITAAEKDKRAEGGVRVKIPGKVKKAIDKAIDEKATVEEREEAIKVVQGHVAQMDRALRTSETEEGKALVEAESDVAAQKVRDQTLADLKDELEGAKQRIQTAKAFREREQVKGTEKFLGKIDEKAEPDEAVIAGFDQVIEEQEARVKEIETSILSFVEDALVGEPSFVEGGPAWLGTGLASMWQPGKNDAEVAAISVPASDIKLGGPAILDVIRSRTEELGAYALANPNLQLPKTFEEMTIDELDQEIKEQLSPLLPESITQVNRATVIEALEEIGGKKVDLTDRTTQAFSELIALPWGELKSIARDTGIPTADYLEENREDLVASIVLMREQKARRVAHEQVEGSAEAIMEKLNKAEMEAREGVEEGELTQNPLNLGEERDLIRIINAFPDRVAMMQEVRAMLVNENIISPITDEQEDIDNTVIEATSILIPWVESERQRRGKLLDEEGTIARLEDRNRPIVKMIKIADATVRVAQAVDFSEEETEFPHLVEQEERDRIALASEKDSFRRISRYHAYLDERWAFFVSQGAIFESDRQLLRVILAKSGTDMIKNIVLRLDATTDATAYFQMHSLPGHPSRITLFLPPLGQGPGAPRAGMAWVFMHELGHAAFFEYMTVGERQDVINLFTTLKTIKSKKGSQQNNRAEDLLVAAGLPSGAAIDYAMQGPHEFFAELFASHVIRKAVTPSLLRRIFNKVVARVNRVVGGPLLSEAFPEVKTLEATFDKLLGGQGLTRQFPSLQDFDHARGLRVYAGPIEDNLEDTEGKALEKRVTEELEEGPLRDPRHTPFPEELFAIIPGTKEKKKPGRPVFVRPATERGTVVEPEGERRVPRKETTPLDPLTARQRALFPQPEVVTGEAARDIALLERFPEKGIQGINAVAELLGVTKEEATGITGRLVKGKLLSKKETVFTVTKKGRTALSFRAAPSQPVGDLVAQEIDFLGTVIRDNPLVRLVRGELKGQVVGDSMRVHEMSIVRQTNYARTMAQVALADVKGFPERFVNGLSRLAYALNRMDRVEASIVARDDFSQGDRKALDLLILEQFPLFRERIKAILVELQVDEAAVRRMPTPTPAAIREIAADDTHPQALAADMYLRAAQERVEDDLATRLVIEQELEVRGRLVTRKKGELGPRVGKEEPLEAERLFPGQRRIADVPIPTEQKLLGARGVAGATVTEQTKRVEEFEAELLRRIQEEQKLVAPPLKKRLEKKELVVAPTRVVTRARTNEARLQRLRNRQILRRRRAARSGMVLSGPWDTLAGIALLPFKAVDFVVEKEARLLVDLVETHGGKGESAKIIADVMRKAVDQNKAFLGQMQKMFVEVQRILNRRASVAAIWKMERAVQVPGQKNWVVVPLEELITRGNTKKGGGLSKGERDVIISIRRVTRATAKILQEVGLMQKTKGGQRLFQRALLGRVFLRMATTQMHDLLVRGPGAKDYQVMVTAFADANHVSEEVIQGVFEGIRQSLVGEMKGSFRMIGPEIQRRLPVAPTHIWIKGKPVELFVVNPRQYIDRMIRDTASRASVVKFLGQGSLRVRGLRKIYTKGGGSGAIYDATVRALSNLPPYSSQMTMPTVEGSLYRTARIADAMFGVVRAGLLTAAVVPNIPEPLGTIGPVLGYKKMVQGLLTMADPVERKQAMTELLRTRMYTQDIVDFSLRRNHAIEGVLRKTADFINRGFGIKFINESQERLYGFVTLIWMNAMFDHGQAAGKPAQVDIWRLRIFGYTTAEARHLAMGEGTQAEYETLGRRAVRFFISSATLRAESSQLRNTRWYPFTFWFTTFFSDTVRILDRHGKVWVDSIPVYGKEGSPAQLWQASMGLGRFIGGKALAGAAAAFIWSLALGGLFAMRLKKEELFDDVGEFVSESWIYSMFGGVYGAVLNTALRRREAESVETTLMRTLRVVGPAAVFMDVGNWALGTGPYRDQGWGEKMIRFGQLHVTASRTIPGRVAMMIFGEAMGDPKTDFAVRQYWVWRFDSDNEVVPARTVGGSMTAEHKEFRLHMRRAGKRQREGLNPYDELIRALLVDGKDIVSVNASLRGKLLLIDLDFEQQERLRRFLGNEGFNLIFWHDQMIEEMMFRGRAIRRPTRPTRPTRATR